MYIALALGPAPGQFRRHCFYTRCLSLEEESAPVCSVAQKLCKTFHFLNLSIIPDPSVNPQGLRECPLQYSTLYQGLGEYKKEYIPYLLGVQRDRSYKISKMEQQRKGLVVLNLETLIIKKYRCGGLGGEITVGWLRQGKPLSSTVF